MLQETILVIEKLVDRRNIIIWKHFGFNVPTYECVLIGTRICSILYSKYNEFI